MEVSAAYSEHVAARFTGRRNLCLKERKYYAIATYSNAGDWIDTNFPKGNPTDSSIANPQQLFPLPKVALDAHALGNLEAQDKAPLLPASRQEAAEWRRTLSS